MLRVFIMHLHSLFARIIHMDLLMNYKNYGFIDRKGEKVFAMSTAKIVSRIKCEKDNIPIEKFQHKFNAFDAFAIICVSF